MKTECMGLPERETEINEAALVNAIPRTARLEESQKSGFAAGEEIFF